MLSSWLNTKCIVTLHLWFSALSLFFPIQSCCAVLVSSLEFFCDSNFWCGSYGLLLHGCDCCKVLLKSCCCNGTLWYACTATTKGWLLKHVVYICSWLLAGVVAAHWCAFNLEWFTGQVVHVRIRLQYFKMANQRLVLSEPVKRNLSSLCMPVFFFWWLHTLRSPFEVSRVCSWVKSVWSFVWEGIGGATVKLSWGYELLCMVSLLVACKSILIYFCKELYERVWSFIKLFHLGVVLTCNAHYEIDH